MSIFSQLKQQLSQQLREQTPTSGLVEYHASVPLPTSQVALLGWLKAQSHYPHVFWQSRETDFTIVSIGEVKHFSSLDKAQHFVQQHATTLVGGVQFEGDCHFVLPRLKLVKTHEKLTAYFFLHADEVAQQAVIFDQIFANFEKIRPLALSPNALISSSTACDFAYWQANIEQAIAHIQQQKFNKVVLANATTLQFEHAISAYDLLHASQPMNLGCYHFLWAENAQSAFVGSSPERLYYRADRTLQTEALAGTAPVTDSDIQTALNAEWLLTDPKNIYENQLVVDDIFHHLANCVTDIEVFPAEIKRLHNVQHLRRRIYATLTADISDADCLACIHPTAAVAGLPRQPAKHFIAEHEPFTRGWYAGTLGYLNTQQAEFCVALRSATLLQNAMTLYAGAGIVAESEPVSEWQEIERKSQALAKLLKNFTPPTQ